MSGGFIVKKKDVRFEKARARIDQFDAVAQELMTQHIDFVTHHRIHPNEKVLQGNLFLHTVGIAIDGVLAIAREVHDRFAHGLAGNSADVNADTADHRPAFHHDDAFTELGTLDSSMMSCRPRADYREIEIEIRHRDYGDS